MPRIGFYTLQQAVAMINDDNFTGDDVEITVLQPNRVDDMTDEENFDDDVTGDRISSKFQVLRVYHNGCGVQTNFSLYDRSDDSEV